ncbi:hypothetical protein O4J55_26915, partial [Paracoccus sp. PXZ]
GVRRKFCLHRAGSQSVRVPDCDILSGYLWILHLSSMGRLTQIKVSRNRATLEVAVEAAILPHPDASRPPSEAG